MVRFQTFLLLFAVSVFYGQSSREIINADNGKLLVSELREGTSDYLVYFTDSLKTKRSNGDLWRRTTKFRKLNSKEVAEFTWLTMTEGRKFREVTNLVDRKTMAPIFHKTVYHETGIAELDAFAGVRAFDYKKDRMVASDSIANNKMKGNPPILLDIPIISWEQDLETYRILPIRHVGQVFDVAFFDPNEKKATYHTYTVAGKEMLKLNDDTKVNCWMLITEYPNNAYSKFWLSEKSKQVLKMEEFFNGRYRFKVLQY